jgi:hypothetical protein
MPAQCIFLILYAKRKYRMYFYVITENDKKKSLQFEPIFCEKNMSINIHGGYMDNVADVTQLIYRNYSSFFIYIQDLVAVAKCRI